MIPYNQVKDSSVVVFKVIANEPPALVDNLNVNDTIRGLLKRCWSPAVQRPHIRECHEILLQSVHPGELAFGLRALMSLIRS